MVLGSILASFGRPWALLGASWELFGDRAAFDTFPCTESSSILGTILAPNCAKIEKVLKKQCLKNGVKQK